MQSKVSKSRLFFGSIEWSKYMVYIVFVIMFALFSIVLGNKGLLTKTTLLIY